MSSPRLQSQLTRSELETQRLGARLAADWEFPLVLLLEGDLGSGKTAFVRGIVEGLGGNPAHVHSPTFSLVNHYSTERAPVQHIDLYRLESEKDQYSIGLEEILSGEGLVVVEWAEKLRLPVEHALTVRIRVEGPELRSFEISSIAAP